MRLYTQLDEIEEYLQLFEPPLSQAYNFKHKNLYAFEMYSSFTPSAASTEIAAPTTILDATAASVLLLVKSSTVNDINNAGGHVRKVRLIGWGTGSVSGTSASAVPQIENILMNGTTAVNTVKYWTRIQHVYATLFGSGGSHADGIISVKNAADAVTYITIAALATESSGSQIYVPNGYKSLIKYFEMRPAAAMGANGTIATIEHIGFDDATNLTPQYDTLSYQIISGCPYILHQPDNFQRVGTSQAYYRFKEIRVTAAFVTEIRILVLIWK
jgi:hypothetical protein